MADLNEVAVHDADGGEERLAPVALGCMQAENFLNGVGAVILRNHPSQFFLHTFLVMEAVKIILQRAVDFRIKIIENLEALLDVTQA